MEIHERLELEAYRYAKESGYRDSIPWTPAYYAVDKSVVFLRRWDSVNQQAVLIIASYGENGKTDLAVYRYERSKVLDSLG